MIREDEELDVSTEKEGKSPKWGYAAIGGIIGLILFGTVGAFLCSNKEPKEVVRYVETGDTVIDAGMGEELDNLMMYLKDMDDSVLYNSSALDSVGDYSSLVKNKISDIKNNLDETINFINNYLEAGAAIDSETREMLKGMVESLTKLKESISGSEGRIYQLLEEYRNADEERQIEIQREIESIMKSFTNESDNLKSKYDEILRFMASMSEDDKEANKELWNLLDGLKNKMDRFLDKEFASLKDLLSGETMNLSMQIDKKFAELNSVMEELHDSIENNEQDITKIYKSINPREKIDNITNEIKTTNQEIKNIEQNIENSTKNINENIDKSTKTIGDKIDNSTSTVNKNIDESTKTINENIDNAETNITKSIENSEKNLTKNISEVNDNVSDLKQQFVDAHKTVKEMLADIETLIDKSNTEINEHMDDQFAALNETLANYHNELKAVLESMKVDLETMIEENFTQVNETLNEMNTTMVENFNEVSESINNQYEKVINIVNNNDDSLKEYLENMQGNINAKFDSVFQRVSDGKRLLASALLTKGVECPEDATFYQIYEAILSIKQTIMIGELPGEIEYDYHYHTDGNGNIVHESQVGKEQGGGCFTEPVKHTHKGSSSSGGGCYTVKHTGTREGKCYGSAYASQGPFGPDTSGQVYYVANCPVCGNNLSRYGSPGNVNCDRKTSESYTYYSLGCGMDNNTIIGYKIGCGLSDGQIVGAHIVYKQGYGTGYNGPDAANFAVTYASPMLEPDYDYTEITDPSVPEAKPVIDEPVQDEQKPEEGDTGNTENEEETKEEEEEQEQGQEVVEQIENNEETE